MYINKFGLYEDIVNNLIKGNAYKNNDVFKRFYNTDKTVIAMDYTLPAGITIEEHFHDWIEITLVVKGEQHITVGDVTYILTDGDFMMIDYNEIHSSCTIKPTDKLTIQFKNGYIEKMIPSFSSSDIFCNTSAIKDSFDQQSYLTIIELYCFMFRSFAKCSLNPEADFYGFFYLFFYTVMKYCESNSIKEKERVTQNIYIAQILSYINRHYNEPISLDRLADALHLTPQYISKIIKENIGQGFKEYLVELRLEHAKTLIKTTNKTLLSIGEECGFPNNKSFINYFKQEFGVTPSQYKRQINTL